MDKETNLELRIAIAKLLIPRLNLVLSHRGEELKYTVGEIEGEDVPIFGDVTGYLKLNDIVLSDGGMVYYPFSKIDEYFAELQEFLEDSPADNREKYSQFVELRTQQAHELLEECRNLFPSKSDDELLFVITPSGQSFLAKN